MRLSYPLLCVTLVHLVPVAKTIVRALRMGLRGPAGRARTRRSERHVAEEDALDLRGAQELLRRPLQDRPPRLEHVAPIGQAQRHLDVLLDEDDADAFLVADP